MTVKRAKRAATERPHPSDWDTDKKLREEFSLPSTTTVLLPLADGFVIRFPNPLNAEQVRDILTAALMAEVDLTERKKR